MSKPTKSKAASTEGLTIAFLRRKQSVSVEKLAKPADSPSISLNRRPSPGQKIDRPVQTDESATSVNHRDFYSLLLRDSVESGLESLTVANEYREVPNLEDFFGNSSIKSEPSISDEKSEDKSMDVRKQYQEACKNGVIVRATSDLERRKLEAELKATEEIAKIQQTVIEKRLAYELAIIQGDPDFQPNARPILQPQADLTAYEEWAAKKQKIIKKNLAIELDSLSRTSAPRPPLPPRPNVMDLTKRKKSRPEIVNRAINSQERKEIGFVAATKDNEFRPSNTSNVAPSPEVRYMAPTCPRYPNRMEEPSLSFARPGQSAGNANSDTRHISIWRTVMTKVKRRFTTKQATKNPGPWE